jgi:hypothetical protein
MRYSAVDDDDEVRAAMLGGAMTQIDLNGGSLPRSV